MNRKKAARGAVAVAAGALLLELAATEPWKERPPTTWTQEETLALLTHSPWAQEVRMLQATGRMLVELPNGKQVVVQDESGRRIAYVDPPVSSRPDFPPPARPELVEAVYVVRWSSAEVVQQAFGRLQAISPALTDLQAPPRELPADKYVLTARVAQPPSELTTTRLDRPLIYSRDPSRPPEPSPPPSVPDLFAGLTPDELKEHAELRTAKKLRVKADRVVRHGVGAGEGISFFFPRRVNGHPSLPPGTSWAEFVFHGIRDSELKVKFKLTEMRAGGQPDY